MSLLAEEMKALVFLVLLCATTYAACNCASLHKLPLKKRYCDSTNTIVRARIMAKGNYFVRPVAPGGSALQYYGVNITRVSKGTKRFKGVSQIYVHTDCGVDFKVGAVYMLEVEWIFYGLLHTPCGIAELWRNTKWLRSHLQRYKNDTRVNCRRLFLGTNSKH